MAKDAVEAGDGDTDLLQRELQLAELMARRCGALGMLGGHCFGKRLLQGAAAVLLLQRQRRESNEACNCSSGYCGGVGVSQRQRRAPVVATCVFYPARRLVMALPQVP
jgi:hypothetical protein